MYCILCCQVEKDNDFHEAAVILLTLHCITECKKINSCDKCRTCVDSHELCASLEAYASLQSKNIPVFLFQKSNTHYQQLHNRSIVIVTTTVNNSSTTHNSGGFLFLPTGIHSICVNYEDLLLFAFIR